MSQFPTTEEEFEMMYGEELEMMNEMDEPEIIQKPVTTPARLTSSTQHQKKNSVTLGSPALSQISRDGFNAFTPAQNRNANKKTSTPFLDKLKTADVNRDREDEENLALNEIQNIGIKRKRRILNDLFGDMYDLEEEDLDAKKQKTEEERDMDTIEKIVEARKALDIQTNPLKSSGFDRLEALHKFKKDNLTRTIPKYPFVPLSTNSDDRVYVRCHTEEFEKNALKEIKSIVSGEGGFFKNQEREIMWNEANELIMKDAAKRATENADIVQVRDEAQTNKAEVLMVDKYRPKKYVDLLSDESTNRSLLQWIKLFDKAVFNREVHKKTTKPGELSNFNKKTGRFEQNGGWQRRRQKGNLNTDLDEHGCPIQKIALLAGRPGLAKTTLAHIIASHAGYEVQEKNASDDRTVESFRQTLENCTQMTSVLNRDNRPNCIILDEIDGAPIASIEYLIRFVSGQVTAKGAKKGNNKKKFILKRPIICICNDLYGANLRQLRQIAFVVNFQAIDSSRLAERLHMICIRERIKTDMAALLTMAEKSGGDIRSCLSILQFYASKKKPLTLFDVLKSDVGQKDQQKSLFNAWTSIFQIQRPKKVLRVSNESGQRQIGMSDSSAKFRMAYVMETVNACGEYEKLTQGVHENFLRQKFQDGGTMNGVVEASQWFCFNDRVQNQINSLQNYTMYPYLQYAFISWNFSCASLAYPQIKYPQKQYEVMQKLNNAKQILGSLRKGINCHVRGIGVGSEVMVDTVNLLKIIINPEIRSVSMHLLSQKEKQELQHTVEVIADFNLTLVQLQASDGTFTYRAEPDIDHFSFTGIPQKQISYWSKQMIAQEVEVEKMRRSRPKINKDDDEVKRLEKEFMKINEVQPELNKVLPNHLQRLVPKSIKSTKPTQLVCKDFFGRIITKPSVAASTSSQPTASEDDNDSSDILVKSPIWFKFKEGYNAAVRKDFHFVDLL